jgi:Tol biopolymer transport system component
MPPTEPPTPTPTPTPALEGKIAYVMKDGIYVMDADGSNRRRVYEGDLECWDQIAGKRVTGLLGRAVLSSDGNKIAFARNDGLWVMDVNGSGMQQIVTRESWYAEVAWAPDSSQILYRDSYLIKIPGGIPEHIGGGMDEADWSPDGGWFAYQGPQGLAKRAVSGGSEFVLDPSVGWGACPAWSPDGTRIAYTKDGDIFVINADGSGQTKLTDHPAGDWEPRWSPDGDKIVFTTERDGNKEIYVMNPDGSNQMNLTNSAENEEHPSWAP